jgi:hypothetical protein
MVLDSNGSCDGERRMLCEMRSAMLLERMTATRWKLADDPGTFLAITSVWPTIQVSPEVLNSKAVQLLPQNP